MTDAQPSDQIHILVVGAHLSGLPLNHQLTDLGGTLVGAVKTADRYRLFALPNTQPPKPGMLAVEDGAGASIKAEVWALSAEGFGKFVAALPSPMCIGSVTLSDGSQVKGFLVESIAVEGADDITAFGGWRAYLESLG